MPTLNYAQAHALIACTNGAAVHVHGMAVTLRQVADAFPDYVTLTPPDDLAAPPMGPRPYFHAVPTHAGLTAAADFFDTHMQGVSNAV